MRCNVRRMTHHFRLVSLRSVCSINGVIFIWHISWNHCYWDLNCFTGAQNCEFSTANQTLLLGIACERNMLILINATVMVLHVFVFRNDTEIKKNIVFQIPRVCEVLWNGVTCWDWLRANVIPAIPPDMKVSAHMTIIWRNVFTSRITGILNHFCPVSSGCAAVV